MKKKRKFHKLTRIEKSLILLADYMEDPTHDRYQMKKMILDILGLELLPDENK